MSEGVVGPQAISDARGWDAHVLSMPEPHILQSWAWGETKAQTGWRAKRLIWSEATPIPKIGGHLTTWATASVLFRRLNDRMPFGVAYAPKGPLLDWSDEELRVRVLRDLEHESRKAHALFIKIDPDVQEDSSEGRALVDLLQKRGWVYSQEQIQYRNTMVSDLAPDEDTLLAGMKPKWRYNIRLAERRGVCVRDGSAKDLPAFYAMYAETGGRDQFLVRPFSYYQVIWERFLADGLAHLLLAEVDRKPVAGLMLFCYGPTAWYFYGASTSEARDLMPNHALQWAALRWAKGRACARYDWWGAPDKLEENDPMWGVYRFKQGFGGEFMSHVGAWDYPVNKPLYWAYTRAMPKALDVMRRRHRRAADTDGQNQALAENARGRRLRPLTMRIAKVLI